MRLMKEVFELKNKRIRETQKFWSSWTYNWLSDIETTLLNIEHIPLKVLVVRRWMNCSKANFEWILDARENAKNPNGDSREKNILLL